jgi:transcriptional regulator with XRE-family HTH domain
MVADNTHAKDLQLVLKRFGATLRRVRHAKDISQEELAVRCGLHRTEISLLERGLRSPRLCTLLLLATELEVPMAALVDHLPAPKARRPHTPRARW